MLIKCRRVVAGPGPAEVIVEIQTDRGAEEVVVPEDRLAGNSLEIGHILALRDGFVLINLPRESVSGQWRLWVPETEMMQTA